MKKILVLFGALAIGTVLLPATFWLGNRIIPVGGLIKDDVLSWRFYERKANLAYCIREHALDCQVELVPWMCCAKLEFRDKHGELIFTHDCGSDDTVFTRSGTKLFLADYGGQASGCGVLALDLTTRKLIWHTHLQGSGTVNQTNGRNRVNIETDGQRILVYGNESHGRYVEILDPATGKTLANRKLDP